MKNVFCLIVDAMSYQYMHDGYGTTPFLDELSKKGHICKNMFSQGPYTEAALTPFYTGRDNLDGGGNYFRGEETPKNMFEAFLEAGYDVLNYTQPLIYPTPMGRGINEERYGVAYHFTAVWDYRISYYKPFFENGTITETDYQNIYRLLDGNFAFWLQYLTDCKDGAIAAEFINRYANPKAYDFDKNIAAVRKEYDAFLKDKRAYVDELLTKGENHSVFSIPKYEMNDKADNAELYREIADEHKPFFKKLVKFNKKHNKDSEGRLGRTVKNGLKACLKGNRAELISVLKKHYYFRKLCNTKAEVKELFEKRSNYKPEPTIMEYFRCFREWEEKRSAEKPYFCMMHVSDLHTPEIFFSIDSQDKSLIKSELDEAERYLDGLPKNFAGNITYNLSMHYVDRCVKQIYEWFEKTGKFENTLFVVSADHGSSFRYAPLRDSLVNNRHEENYHIPCLFYGAGITPAENGNYYTTKDIVKTMLVTAGADSADFQGTDILSGNKQRYSITEYLGGGCPDIFRKSLLLTIRNDEYCVGLCRKLTEPFAREQIVCVYDRKNDPFELRNIVGETEFTKIEDLVGVVNARFDRIKEQTKKNG